MSIDDKLRNESINLNNLCEHKNLESANGEIFQTEKKFRSSGDLKKITMKESCENRGLLTTSANFPNCEENIFVYKKRWLILIIYVLYSAANAMQWLEYCIIINIIKKYYNVSDSTVDWTSMVTMITYAPFVLPSNYIVFKKGIRAAVLTGIFITMIGSWIKVFSLEPHLFWVTLLGQTIIFSSQPLILSLPPHIAAIWFPENEVSTACAIGVFGSQFGTAIGFILPTLIVHDHDDAEIIREELSYMFYGIAVFTLFVAALILAFFKNNPEKPPSYTQAEERKQVSNEAKTNFFEAYKKLLKNKPFILLIIAYGINIAVFYGICTLFNDFILTYFPKSEDDAGRMGILMIVLGMIGSVLFGLILDKTRKYKELNLIIYFVSTISVLGFMVSLQFSKLIVYLTVSAMGFFLNSYCTVAFELAIELTFPLPESTSSGLLLSTAQTFGVLFILIFRAIFSNLGTVICLIFAAILLLIGTVITYLIKNDLKRQAAFKKFKLQENQLTTFS